MLHKLDKYLLVKLIENIENYESLSIEELLKKRDKIEFVLQKKIKEKRVKYVKDKLLSILKLPNFSHYSKIPYYSSYSFTSQSSSLSDKDNQTITLEEFIEGITEISIDSHTLYFNSNIKIKEKEEKEEISVVFFKNLDYLAPSFFTFLKEQMIAPVRVYFSIWYSINEYILKESEVGWFAYDYSLSPFLIRNSDKMKYILNDELRVEFYYA